MGIRFKCHQCGHELHVKDFQAGKRSKCPNCSIRFRIPNESAATSIALEDGSAIDETTAADSPPALTTATKAAPVPKAKSTSTTANSPLPASPKTVSNAAGQSTTAAMTNAQTPPTPVPPPAASDSKPRALTEAPEAAWYVQPPTGGQYGPAPSDIFAEWLAEHRVTRDSLVWREGWEQWQAAGDVFPECFGSTPAGSPASPPEVIPQNSVTKSSALGTAPAPAMTTSPAAATSPTASLDRARLTKKMKRKRNYTLMISILAVISIGLVIALIIVLSR